MAGISLLTDCAIPTGPYPITPRLRGDTGDIAIRCRVETARTSISGMAFVIRTALFPGAFSKDASINTAINHEFEGIIPKPKLVRDRPWARGDEAPCSKNKVYADLPLSHKVQVSVSMTCDSHAVSCVGVVK